MSKNNYLNPVSELAVRLKESHVLRTEINLKRGENLVNQGKVDSNLYYIVEGSVMIFIHDHDKHHIVRLGYDGDIILALDSFISDKATQLNICAIKKCKLWMISKSDFMKFVNSNENLMQLWNSVLMVLLSNQLDREIDLLTHSPQDRYRRILNRNKRLFQHIPRKYIANYLRMTPETLARIKTLDLNQETNLK